MCDFFSFGIRKSPALIGRYTEPNEVQLAFDGFKDQPSRAMHLRLALLSAAMLFAGVVTAQEKLDESSAIEKIELLGGRVERDEKLPNRPVIGVHFGGSKRVSDKYLYLLTSLPNIKTLNLEGTRVTDAGLKELRSLTHLSWLSLRNTGIAGTGLKDLAPLTDLEELELFGTQVTDVRLADLRTFEKLRVLDLWGTKVTDDGLKELVSLRNLRTLNLRNTKVTAAGVNALKKSLPNVRVSDEF